jgi:hypothetical protein
MIIAMARRKPQHYILKIRKTTSSSIEDGTKTGSKIISTQCKKVEEIDLF